MSLFDKPESNNISEIFPEGTPLTIHWATYDGLQETEFGPREQATLGATQPGADEREAKTYRVWGTLALQIETMEDGELPATVTIGKEGRRKVWLPVDEDIPF